MFDMIPCVSVPDGVSSMFSLVDPAYAGLPQRE